jgi:hypothetical protein
VGFAGSCRAVLCCPHIFLNIILRPIEKDFEFVAKTIHAQK